MKSTWFVPCLLAVGLAAAVFLAIGVEAETIVVAGAAVACPLMMLLMMGGGIHRVTHRRQGAHTPADTASESEKRSTTHS